MAYDFYMMFDDLWSLLNDFKTKFLDRIFGMFQVGIRTLI